MVRRAVLVRGVVQGVGVRPYVHALATRLGLSGHVGNDGAGVALEVEGAEHRVSEFMTAIEACALPLARVESVVAAPLEPRGDHGFRILASVASSLDVAPVSPDVAPCDDCLRELCDPADRRYRYPFVNCTNCGPRYTIVRDVPYDRARTTMAGFAMCPACAREYADPGQRRFHAQPNACPDCGPQLRWVVAAGAAEPITREAALQAAVTLLRAGGIVAVKGVGGFHLACDATSREAITRLRERKQRSDKPFAILASNIFEVRRFARVSEQERAALQGPARPVVLLDRSPRATLAIAPEVAPGQGTLGVMLPPSPLHHLLAEAGPLVLTSGNRSEEPIARENEEALERLAHIADGFLVHDRPIHVVCDDSVVRLCDGSELPIRRSRGYAPYPVRLPRRGRSVLAVGADLKATACLTRDGYALLTPHVGDLGNLQTLEALHRACDHFERLFRVAPAAIACDRHPDYVSSRWARTVARARGLPLVEVQHHHAHLASLAAEHHLDDDESILAFVFDGTGFGDDATVWGGEALLGGSRAYERVAHLAPAPLPGGDAAVRHPARVALAHLWAASADWEGTHAARTLSETDRRILRTQLERGINCVTTSSMGRLLDAAASLAGVRHEVSYEGQAAMELESLAHAGSARVEPYDLPIGSERGRPHLLDGATLLRAVAADAARGRDVRDIARAVHAAIARSVTAVAEVIRRERGIGRVGLTGGVFQNGLLLSLSRRQLREAGFSVLVHERVPPNDGGIALGQARVALSTEAGE